MEHFGSFLKSIRGDMSLRKAAEKSGLSHTYISFLEKGEHPKTHKPINPTPDTLKALANAYNYPYKDLLLKAGYLSNQYSLDFETGGTRPATVEESYSDYLTDKRYKDNDIRKILYDNNDLNYGGRVLTMSEKERIIQLIPILINE